MKNQLSKNGTHSASIGILARPDRKVLLAIPLLTYFFSYLYLAWYHGKANLWHVLVHESGKLSFYQDFFYSSHFLGHVPVHLIVALFFMGVFLSITPAVAVRSRYRFLFGFGALAFLGLALLHAFIEFGPADTWDYILQRKQGANRFGEGGSFKLHLVSTVSLPFFLPVYLLCGRWLFDRPVVGSTRGLPWLVVAGLLLFPLSYLLEGEGFFGLCWEVLTDNRYLAHSVRELVTFSLCYFPISLFVFFRLERDNHWAQEGRSKIPIPVMVLSTGIFLVLLAYQTCHPLAEGIGILAQKPAFAKGHHLGIAYLLAAHFFEHFLDTLFFTLVAGFMSSFSSRVKA